MSPTRPTEELVVRERGYQVGRKPTVADERIQQKTQIRHTAYLRFSGGYLEWEAKFTFFTECERN